MSAIAREFECTPSAISYIIKKAESAGLEPGEAPAAEGETEAAPNDAAPVEATPAPAPVATPAPAPAPATRATATAPLTTLSLPERTGGPLRNLPPPSAAPPCTPAPQPAAGEAPRPAGEAGGRPNQPAPVDGTEARLRETARGCLVAYRGWRTTPGETSIQTLNDAVHELRKVLARIEIDMSASRREEQGQRPIPIPPHRAARPR